MNPRESAQLEAEKTFELFILWTKRVVYIAILALLVTENRATNRRTRIIIMPKIDQFYDMIEKEMQNLSN